jgi:predicted nucleic acid-binding protein
MEYLLDTNIVLTYARNTEVTKKLEAKLNLLSGDHRLIISVVSVGELKAFMKKNKWGNKKISQLEKLVDEFMIADINVEEIIERYAEIDAFSQGKLENRKSKFTARNMGKNDLWIAATASYLDIELITTDKDFEHLNGEYLIVNQIDLTKL